MDTGQHFLLECVCVFSQHTKGILNWWCLSQEKPFSSWPVPLSKQSEVTLGNYLVRGALGFLRR